MEPLIVVYVFGLILHLICSLWVCSCQKQPVAVRWCVVPIVTLLWPLFSIRMAIRGYDNYLSENTKE